MRVLRWAFLLDDAGEFTDFVPRGDHIDHERGEGCICGPRQAGSGPTVWRHVPLNKALEFGS